jgi:pimeloyl-ACP methyl ester carboxylesterase
MPFVDAGEVRLSYVERGRGEVIVVYIHGNLGCKEWLDLFWPYLPEGLRVIAIEWRGCGDSDKPAPDPEYANYSMPQHAADMIAAIRELGIRSCHLCGHSTGGIIALHMLLLAPEMFGKLLVLDPVGPMGLNLVPEQLEALKRMKESRDEAVKVLATAMPTLFRPETLGAAGMPSFMEAATAAQRQLFDRLVDRTRELSDGIWFGTPINLAREWQAATLRAMQEQIAHSIFVLWGGLDYWIPREHMEEMARRMPNCKLEIVSGVGHSMNVERPELFARYFRDFFLGGEKLSAATGSRS